MPIPENSHVRTRDMGLVAETWENYGVVMETITNRGEQVPELIVEHLDGTKCRYQEDEIEVCNFSDYIRARHAYRRTREAQARAESDAAFEDAGGQSRN